MRTEVIGANGVRLAVRVVGAEHAPTIVFVHGWAQSATAWAAQFADPELTDRFRLVAVDLRGHGASDAPADGYDDGHAWADDLAAVLECASPDQPAVVVGWSYGGLVIADYLRHRGSAGLAGIMLVGAITELGKDHPGGRTGQAMRDALPDALSEDPHVAIPALIDLTEQLAARPVSGPVCQRLLGASLSVSPTVRRQLFRRSVRSDAVLAGVDVPSLVVHGEQDRVVDPSAAEYAAGKIGRARTRWLEGVGHLPFIEADSEFNAEVRRFTEERLAG